MAKENHMGMLQYHPKKVISQVSNPSVASTAGLNQNIIWGIICPNRGPTSHEVWLLDEVSLSSKIIGNVGHGGYPLDIWILLYDLHLNNHVIMSMYF